MRPAFLSLRTCLALLACLAQLCLPVVHAAMMAAAPAQMLGWCGDPQRAQAFIADLPSELRQAFTGDVASAHHLDACAKLCAGVTTPPLMSALAPTVVLRAAGLEPAPAPRATPALRDTAPRPPSQGPPSSV